MHLNGVATPVNTTAAVHLYRAAVDQGHWRAAHTLALLYDEGKGVERDCVKASQHMRAFLHERGRWQQRMNDALNAYDDGARLLGRGCCVPVLRCCCCWAGGSCIMWH
jgi:hypothetical protein